MSYINQPNSKSLNPLDLSPHFWYNMDDYNFEVDDLEDLKF